MAFASVAGFKMEPVSGRKWTYACRAVCSVENLAPLMAALIDVCLPEPHYAILTGHWFGDQVDTFLSDFVPRSRIEAAFSPHLQMLLHDGMVGHGFACYDDDRHEEIFLDDHKELTVLTSAPLAVAEVLVRNGLPRNEALEFLSQHGHVHVSLGGQDAKYCHQIIQALSMRKADGYE